MTGLWLVLAVVALAPNLDWTPGVLNPRAQTYDAICHTAWGKDARHVTERMKTEVALRYGMARSAIKPAGQGPCCEFDHLIPRELGGDDNIANLWPQPWADAHVKDVEENHLHRAYCAGAITLEAAQRRMRNWRKAAK